MNGYKVFLIAVLSLFLVSCDGSRDKNTWLVGTSADNHPYEYMKDGEIVGFDIDLAVAIGQHLGKNIEFKNMDFHGLLAALASKNVDLVMAGMSITPERMAEVAFSIPYTEAKVAILSRGEDNLKTLEDLKGKNIGAQLGTTWALAAKEMSVIYGFRTQTLANNLMLVEELKTKRSDAVVLEEMQAKAFVAMYPEFVSFSVPQYSTSFAVAMPKDSPIKEDIDRAINDLKGDGTIDILARKWGIISGQ